MDFLGYTIITSVCETDDFCIYRALKPNGSEDGPVLIKVPSAHRPPAAIIRSLEHEYEVARELDATLIARPIELVRHADSIGLVLENGSCQTLSDFLGAPMEIGQFLWIAIGITTALAEIHSHDLVHKDIKPQNILINKETGQVRITGFGIASRLPRERQTPEPPDILAGTLAYMAPEQTGRMNRSIDSRSDLYALGVTFYQMLTGVLPFTASDPMEWVHCHIARQPVPPVQRVPNLPEPLSELVMKLLAKTAEERYQSAAGLDADLRYCLEEWESEGRIDPFPLGEHDVPDRLLIPEKLYGRQSEIETLLAAFDRVVVSGTLELVLVSGYSGVGKSSVVHELHKALVPPRGLFVAGKFDQYKRDIPYATLVQALQTLIRQILAKNETEVREWRDALQEAVSPNGQLIVSLIPEVELIIGKQPPVPEVPPQEARNRFQMVLLRFLGVFAGPEHPLALFLDDLQWLDAATLDLMEQLATGQEVRHLLLIGAYRDNEVGPTHPLMRMLEAIHKRGVGVQEIVLAPLTIDDVGSLVADSLHCERERASPLSQLVYEKTGGNPFFIIQFLTALAEEKLLAFDPGAVRWIWDMVGIHVKGYTDNVVDLMVRKLGHLPATTLETLEQLACLGNVAEIATLITVSGQPEEALHAALWEAVRAGLVFHQEKTYAFLHDRVQEAAYVLVPETRRKELHLKIARLLLAQYSQEVQAERVFDVVNQFNRSVELVTDAEERATLRRLNTAAGRKARAAAAYASARRYLEQAMALLPPDPWNECYAESLALFQALAECEYLVGNFERADELLTAALEKARSTLDLADIHRLRLRLYLLSGRFPEAMEVVFEALRLFGITFPETDEDIRMAAEAEHRLVSDNMGGRRVLDLLDAPLASDAETRTLIGLIIDGDASIIIMRPRIYHLWSAKAVNICLQRGHVDESSFVYASYASTLASYFRDPLTAQQFFEMAIELNAQTPGAAPVRGRILFLYSISGIIWCEHLAKSLPLLEQAFRACLDFGDLVFAGYVTYFAIWHHLENGDPLERVIEVARRYIAFTRETHNDAVYHLARIEMQFALSLQGKTRSLTNFSDAAFDEAAFIAAIEHRHDLDICYYLAKQIAAFMDARYDEALEWTNRASPPMVAAELFMSRATYCFYHALTLAALHAQAPAGQQRQFQQTLGEIQGKLKRWADNCPENFANRYFLVSAEIARIEGRDLDAMRLYDQAIRSARDNNFVHQEALATEIASRFYRGRGFDRIADGYLLDARAGYARWGAQGKVRQLEQHYPQLREAASLAPGATFPARAQDLDILAVVRASQAISGEILLANLIETLMRTVLTTAGARRGCLLLTRDEGLSLAAEARVENQNVVVQVHGEPGLLEALFPASIINYVRRSRDKVLIDDATSPNLYSSDEYFSRRHPKSVLCFPITRQTGLTGLFYLENDLATHVFTPDRLAVLELLATQAAISLENALVYEALRQSEQKFHAIFDQTFQLIGVLSMDGIMLQANQTALHFAGVSEDAVIGRPFWDTPWWAHSAEMQQRLRAAVQEAAGGKLVRFEATHTGADGRIRYLDFSIKPITDADGRVIQLIPEGRDITERKQAEEALKQAKETAEAANHAKDQFLAMVSHELRTPLTPVLAGLDTLEKEAAGEPQDTVEMMRRNLILESRLIDDLLDLTRIAKGSLSVQLEPVDAHQVIRDALETCRPQLANRQVTLALDAPRHVIAGDPGRLQQVIRNLLLNAGRFTVEGGTIELRTSNPAPGEFRLLCLDNGVGIDPGNLVRIFNAFEQSSRSVKRGYGGLGLGLAISKALVEAHGGTITAHSAGLGAGATFEVTLNTRPDTAALPRPERSPPPSSPPTPAHPLPLHILLVEDHADTRRILERMLRRFDYEVDTAEDVRSARERAQGNGFDFLICDIGLPDGSGLDLVQAIHEHRSIPAIALSGFGAKSDIERSLAAGFAEHLVKPIDFKLLQAAIERVRDA